MNNFGSLVLFKLIWLDYLRITLNHSIHLLNCLVTVLYSPLCLWCYLFCLHTKKTKGHIRWWGCLMSLHLMHTGTLRYYCAMSVLNFLPLFHICVEMTRGSLASWRIVSLVVKQRTILFDSYILVAVFQLMAWDLMRQETFDFWNVIISHMQEMGCFMFLNQSKQCLFRMLYENVIFDHVILCDLHSELDVVATQLLIGSHVVIKQELIAT